MVFEYRDALQEAIDEIISTEGVLNLRTKQVAFRRRGYGTHAGRLIRTVPSLIRTATSLISTVRD